MLAPRPTIRVLIADDQPGARRSLQALLTALRWLSAADVAALRPESFISVEVVGMAAHGEEAVELMQALAPDVVVMDLPPHLHPGPVARLDGLATIALIKRQWPGTRIVVLTMYATARASVLAAGADAFLLKGCSTAELMDALVPKQPNGYGAPGR